MLTLWNGYLPPRARRTRSLFDGFPTSSAHVDRYRSYPSTTVKEEDNGLLLRSEVPGYGPENLDVTFEAGVLTLRGKQLEQKTLEDGVEKTEEHVTFMRSFKLPETIDEEAIEAELKHGVLTVKLPYAEKAKPRAIEVKLG